QSAQGGTLFLDEIGDMPLPLQVKLLRALEERKIRPVGSQENIDVDVRVVAANHRKLEERIAAGEFREDLYYRLNVVKLYIPTLAERREDIPLLTNHFMSRLGERYRKGRLALAPEAMQLLVSAPWPGNVRQLLNVIEQAVALAPTEVIPESLVRQALDVADSALTPLDEARKAFERDYLVRILKITGGNVTKAARLAGRNRTEFYRLLERHSLEPGMFKGSSQKEKATVRASCSHSLPPDSSHPVPPPGRWRRTSWCRRSPTRSSPPSRATRSSPPATSRRLSSSPSRKCCPTSTSSRPRASRSAAPGRRQHPSRRSAWSASSATCWCARTRMPSRPTRARPSRCCPRAASRTRRTPRCARSSSAPAASPCRS